MAISPLVQQYMAGAPQENTLPAEKAFEKKFGDAAYNTFQAKFPNLLKYLVTFKVIESDLDKGTGLATFILSFDKDVLYVPVVMADGSIESCEMVYDKTEDTFAPLTKGMVELIVNKNLLAEPELAPKQYMVDDTKDLFKRMIRPPSISNPIIAGSTEGVYSLPNRVKEKIASYFKDNKDLLAKVAAFYPVKALAEKLASTPEQPEVVSDTPSVISLDELTKEVTASLSAEQKQTILKEGYLVVKEAATTTAQDIIGTNNLVRDGINSLNLTEIHGESYSTPASSLLGTGYVMKIDNGTIKSEKCLVIEDVICTKEGIFKITYGSSLILSNFVDGINASDLIEFDAIEPRKVKVSDFKPGDNSISKDEDDNIVILYPTKNARFKPLKYEGHPTPRVSTRGSESYTKKLIGDDVHLYPKYGFGFGLTTSFVTNIKHGCIKMEEGALLPSTSMLLQKKKVRQSFITSLTQFFNLVNAAGAKLKLSDDGAGTSLYDYTNQKQASFSKKADLVRHLIDAYGFNKEAVDKFLSEKEVLHLNKEAFLTSAPQEQVQRSDAPAGTIYDPQQPDIQPQGLDDFNPDIIDAAVELGDQDILDTGILASVAGDEDIKSLLVDLTPNFTDTITKLGHTLLSFYLNKEELVDYYGREPFQSLVNNLRKVFKILGEIVFTLKSYINMH